MEKQSGFHRYSIGTVAEDKDEDGHIIEIFPIENQSFAEGNIADTKIENVMAKDLYGNSKSVVLNKKSTVRAIWMPFGNSNRSTAPNVKKGEQVEIYRYADTDDFYWDTLYNEFDIRRKEKVIHLYGNTDAFGEELTLDNTYFTKIDTINKLVHIKTNDNDGELTSYDIKIDTKEGILEVFDGKGNIIQLDSAEDKLTATTNDEVIINTKIMTINAIDLNINVTNLNLKSTGTDIKTSTTTIKTDTLDLNSNTNTITSSDTTINSNVTINGSDTNINSKVTIVGPAVTHNGKNIGDTHVHPDAQGGTTGTPQ